MKRLIWEMSREEILKRQRAGLKTTSHGSYRAKRKPNSPRVRNKAK